MTNDFASPPPRTNPAPPVLSRLQNEWHRISFSAAELRTVRRWGLPGSPVSSLGDVLERSGFAHRPNAETGPGTPAGDLADDYLIQLVDLARHHPLAARIVLQRILPPLCAVARRHTLNDRQRHELMDDLVANAWTVIRTYPTERRRHSAAANLVRDITFETIVRPSRRRCAQEVPTQPNGMGDRADIAAVEPLDELIELLHDANGAPEVSADDVAFICQLINHGRPESFAIALDVSPRTVRNRRDVVVHRLRQLAEIAS